MDFDAAYRSGKPLSFGLRQATSVHFNHRQYAEGFEFLSNLVAAGNASEDGKLNSAPTLTPLTQQIALAATLVVHPLFTNRAKSSLELSASDEALRFLRHVLQTLGPVNANFAEAFAFHGSRSRGRVSRLRGEQNPSEKEDEAGTVYSIFANDNSLFSQAQGLWHIVGWAFNCSVLFRNRWVKWKLFLEFFLDVLEQYLKIEPFQPLSEHGFGPLFKLNGAQKRTALRAIFASGNDKSLNEFGEVFKDETKARKTKPEGSKRQAVKIDDDEWGDYENEEDDDAIMEDDAAENSSPAGQNGEDPARNADSTILRARMLSLLCMGTAADEIDSLYDMIAEFMRPLSCHAFASLVGYISLPPESYKRLLAFAVLPYMTNPPKRVDLQTIQQTLLVEDFFPYHANSTSPIDNAKLSLVLERLLYQLLREGGISADEEIVAQISKGVVARNRRTKIDSRREHTADVLEAKDELRLSGERLLLSVKIMPGMKPEQTGSESPLSSIQTQPGSSFD